MLDIFSGLRLVVKRRNINIDNAIFRCHWFFTSTLLVSFSLIITARQYVGQPIECHSTDKIPDSLLNSYCWVQSTFTVPQACSKQLIGIDVPYPCIDNSRGREIKIYAYYQWVGIVLFIQGLLFHLPYYLWKLWENGLIKAITGGLRVAVLNEQDRLKKKNIVVDYINDHLGCHKRYAFKYFLCEFICLINLFAQLWATNKFFDNQFLNYGLEVMQYHSIASTSSTTSTSTPTSFQFIISNNNNNNNQDNIQQLKSSDNNNLNITKKTSDNNNIRQQQVVDPMAFVFPRMTKCTYYDFGSSGDVQKHDALCLLPLNIINEKIYIALWFWFLILAILTTLVIIYRLFAIISESVRCKGLISRCKLSCERDIRLICKHCDVGDWFLFYMVAENLDPLIMREIVSSIAIKINEHLELKKELKIQLELEQQQQLEANKKRNSKQKFKYISSANNREIEATSGQYNFIQPPPPLSPPPPPPPGASAPSAPSRRDSMDSEYLANIFGWQQQQQQVSSQSAKRNSLVNQVSPYVKTLKRRLSNNARWLWLGLPQNSASELDHRGGTASGQQEEVAAQQFSTSNAEPHNNQHHLSEVIMRAAPQSNALVNLQQQQQHLFHHASAPPANQMPLQSMPPPTHTIQSESIFHTPKRRIHHNHHHQRSRAPNLQRRGSLNLLLTSSGSQSSDCDSVAAEPMSSPSSACVMEMESLGSNSRKFEQLGQVLRARNHSTNNRNYPG